MPTPPYVEALREKVGHELLLLPGLVAVVVDEKGRVLLNRRADTGAWSPVSGILEPHEQPETAIAREVLEETGLRVHVEKLVDASTSPLVEYPNGDRAQYLTVAYRCRVAGGTLEVGDDESLEVRFFAPHDLPPLRADLRRCVEKALAC